MQGFSCLQIQRPVGDHHASEGGDGIPGQGIRVGLCEPLPCGEATGVVVLQDGHRRGIILVLGHELDRCIYVQQVVVAQRFAVVLGKETTEVTIERTGLVRILPVTEARAGGFEYREHLGIAAFADPFSNGRIVTR